MNLPLNVYDLKVGKIYLHEKKFYATDLIYKEPVNDLEYKNKATEAVKIETFLLLNKQQRSFAGGFLYSAEYWCKILTTIGEIGWVLIPPEYRFEEIVDQSGL